MDKENNIKRMILLIREKNLALLDARTLMGII
jgi:hypothetical protein